MTEQVWWYATRAAGLMTWSTAVASVMLGLLLSTRALGRKPNGPWLLDVHRFLGGLSAVFLLIHLGSLWADSFVEFGPRELLVPGESTWNPSADALGVSAVTWGIGAAYTLVAVELTSLLRRFVRPALWKAVHYLSVITVGAGTVHAYRAGTDVDNPLVVGAAVGSSLIIVFLGVLRVRRLTDLDSPVARQQSLEELRDRLDNLPGSAATVQPTLDQTDQTALPRRSPTSSGENTLLAGLDPAAAAGQPGAAPLRQDPFAGLQGDDDFDPGGWATAPSRAEGPRPYASRSGSPADSAAADAGPLDARSFLPELQNAAPPVPQTPLIQERPSATESAPPPPPPPPPPAVPPPPPPPPPPSLTAETSPFRAQPDAIRPDPPVAPPTTSSAPAEPAADEHAPARGTPAAASGDDADAWEAALESLLGEGLPKLPRFDLPEIPGVTDPAAPAPPPTPTPVSEPVTSDEPSPVASAIPPTLRQPETPAAPARAETVASLQPEINGPPPLPIDAIDPATGEADEAAYKEWLVEWLAYAERYGDDAPADPTRVDR